MSNHPKKTTRSAKTPKPKERTDTKTKVNKKAARKIEKEPQREGIW